ncbi:DUF4833 domain-containing protein [Mucilaginibacter sp. RS28]|uniref:DUF4833 domain-containing protein n=1 Tax=Mucilaginibacter straminoryzae TaxID=2932774 RepID=A0A9X1X5F9_9SPHI|nr:DUF4833 domain-containing protein [Mucilaginibacter straminoryzae]MCJ8211507.1 DUF4833 domain-containing protein [Mucilaginibacter straminoryzae]
MKRFLLLTTLAGCFFLLSSFNLKPASGNHSLAKDTAKAKIRTELKFPALPTSLPRLFYIQRDPNTNTIVYELNVGSDGQLDNETPVHPYWIKYNEKGQKEELNFIQRKFAYGLVQKELGNGKYDIRLVSYKKYPMTLMKANDGKYHIFATIAQKQVILHRIFVRIEGGSFWVPNVLYVEIKGSDPVTGQEVTDRFKP